MSEVILSDDKPLEVRTLGIFELDRIERPDLGPFTYPMELMGKVIKYAEYKIEKYEETGTPIPQMPSIPEHEITEDMPEWYELRDHKRYEAALWHNKQRLELAAEFCEKVIEYVLNKCSDEEALARIVTEEDWEKYREASLIPQLTMALIILTLKNTYQAKWNEQDIFEALDKVKGGSGTYNVVRLWENNWATKMGFTDLQLATIPVAERARRVSGFMLDGWMEVLEINKMRKKENILDAPGKKT